jgi:hypothetical protein
LLCTTNISAWFCHQMMGGNQLFCSMHWCWLSWHELIAKIICWWQVSSLIDLPIKLMKKRFLIPSLLIKLLF